MEETTRRNRSEKGHPMTIIFKGTVLQTGRECTTAILISQMALAIRMHNDAGRPNSGDLA